MRRPCRVLLACILLILSISCLSVDASLPRHRRRLAQLAAAAEPTPNEVAVEVTEGTQTDIGADGVATVVEVEATPAAEKPSAETSTDVATKEAAVAAAVAELNKDGGKADDKQTAEKFETTEEAPKDGVRLVKDLLTGQLKAVPKSEPAASEAAPADGDNKVSAVVEAALASANVDSATPQAAVNIHGDKPKESSDRHVGKLNFKNLLGGKPSKDAKPMHLSIGSQTGQQDIIKDGQVQTRWNISETSDLVTAASTTVPISQDFSDFFLWRERLDGDRPKRVITGQKPFVFVNNSELLSVKVTSWGPRHMTPIPLSSEGDEVVIDPKTKKPHKNKKHELLFSLQYECHADGASLVSVVVRSFELTTGQRSTETLHFSFMKQCSRPSSFRNDTNTEGNTAFAGLSIGTQHNATNVVQHGQASDAWTIGTENNGNELFTYDDDVEGAKFWMRYNSPVADATMLVNKVLFLIDEPTVLVIEASGDLTEQTTTLTSGRTFTLSLTFTCKKEGYSNVTVAFNFPTVDNGKVSFSFRKNCPGLQVGDGTMMNGIDIWLGQNLPGERPNVVEDGQVKQEWRPLQNLTLEGEELGRAQADNNTDLVSFFIKLRPNYHPVAFDPPIVESYSSSNEVILRPVLTGGFLETNSLKPNVSQFMILSFNCIKNGDAVVTIKIPFRPSGNIQFNIAKQCYLDTAQKEDDANGVSEYSTGEELTPLPGINIGHTIDSTSVVENGIPSPYYHLTDSSAELMPLTAQYQWVNFFLWKNSSYPGSKDIRFGRPELISTADIARPQISGLGAEGGLVADNEYSIISITFHCFTAGNTTITLVIPLVDDEWLNVQNEPVKIKPARSDPIRISFMKECPSETELSVIGMGGIGISGFSVGLTPNTSELVYNGFPQSKYFGQRSKLKPDWDDVIVGKDTESTTLYLHFNSHGLANRLFAKEVLFQAPLVVTHNPTARPVLAGSAANGGVLVRDGQPLMLDVTYNCRYAGIAAVTILIPIIPHGQITMTIPKYCVGDTPPHGVKVTGLHVGNTPRGSEVVKDGQTTPIYLSYATKKNLEHKVFSDDETTTFYIRKDGEPIRAIEPLIYAHKPIVNLRVEHAMRVNDTQVDDDIDGDEIEINSQVSAINITYSCVHAGKTDITVSLNLLPKGQVQWTFEKHCADNDFSGLIGLESFGGDAGISPGSIENGDDDEASRYSVDKFGHGGTTWDADDNPEYARYLEQGDSDRPQPAEASIANWNEPNSQAYGFESDYNPQAAWDHTDARDRQRFSQGLSSFQVGTGKTGPQSNDVFTRSLANSRYAIKRQARGLSLDINQYAVIKPDQDVSTFWFTSTSTSDLKYSTPIVSMDKAFLPFLQPTLSGPASVGGTISSASEPRKLEVRYNCAEKGGVFAVGLRVPIGEAAAVFRVIKICPNYDVKEEFAWTAGRVLTIIGLIVGLIGVGLGVITFRRKMLQRKTAMYTPVQTQQF